MKLTTAELAKILKGEVIEKSHFDNLYVFPKELKIQANKNKFSLPVRLHDFSKINDYCS